MDTPLNLEALDGQWVLLEFWGFWCAGCVHGMPELFALHDAFHDKGLTIIGIHDASVKSLNEMDQKLVSVREKLWSDRHIPFAVGIDAVDKYPAKGDDYVWGQTTTAYGVIEFPTAVLISPGGQVVRRLYAPMGLTVDRFRRLLLDNEPWEQVFPIEPTVAD